MLIESVSKIQGSCYHIFYHRTKYCRNYSTLFQHIIINWSKYESFNLFILVYSVKKLFGNVTRMFVRKAKYNIMFRNGPTMNFFLLINWQTNIWVSRGNDWIFTNMILVKK